MKPASTRILVCAFGLLSGLSLIVWMGSFAEGFFWITLSHKTGIEFIAVQRGTLAFLIEGPAANFPTGQYFWWLESDDMFDKCVQSTPESSGVRLSPKGSFNLMIDSSQYPWRWQSGRFLEGFIPIWVLALAFGIIPVFWTFGVFDKTNPSQPPALPKN
jgi:hypothetical protein